MSKKNEITQSLPAMAREIEQYGEALFLLYTPITQMINAVERGDLDIAQQIIKVTDLRELLKKIYRQT